MTIDHRTISKGFIISGLMNMSVLVFSRFFTNDTIPAFDPVVMSNFGLLMIVLWGVAYMSVAKNYRQVKWLIALFAIEKLVYGYIWIQWLQRNNLSEVYNKDSMAGIFYAVYGVNDWLFCIFFLWVFFKIRKIGATQ